MTDPSIMFDGILPSVEINDGELSDPTMLYHVVKVPDFPLPVVTDKYFLNDVLFYVIEMWFPHFVATGNTNIYMSNGLLEYLDDVLEPEDSELLAMISDKIIEQAKTILLSEEFEYLKNSKDVVDYVTYRYENTEQFARWYFTLRRSGETS